MIWSWSIIWCYTCCEGLWWSYYFAVLVNMRFCEICRQFAFKVGAILVWSKSAVASFRWQIIKCLPLGHIFCNPPFEIRFPQRISLHICQPTAIVMLCPWSPNMIAFIALPWATSFSDSCAKVSFRKTVIHRHPMRDIFRSRGGLFLGHFPPGSQVSGEFCRNWPHMAAAGLLTESWRDAFCSAMARSGRSCWRWSGICIW